MKNSLVSFALLVLCVAASFVSLKYNAVLFAVVSFAQIALAFVLNEWDRFERLN